MLMAIHKAHNKLLANKPATGIKRTTSHETMTKRRTNQIAYTHEFSFSVASKNPLIFQMNVAPSLEPAAIRLISRLNETRDQSQPTLKLSLLWSDWMATKYGQLEMMTVLAPVQLYNCAHSPERFYYLIHSQVQQLDCVITDAAEQVFAILG